jgi:hypothetical protein
MPMSDNESAVASPGAYAAFTPFQDSYTFEAEPSRLAAVEQLESRPLVTPFVSEYADPARAVSAETQELHDLLSELYDQELDELLGQIGDEAWNVVHERAAFSEETGGPARAEQLLEDWISPLRTHAEAMVDSVAEALSAGDPASMSETELDTLFERVEPRGTGLEPLFEEFLGSLGKKLKKYAKGALKIAKKGLALLPVGLLIAKLKPFLRPLLDRVLQYAIDKLPADLRPVARQLADRIFGTPAPAPDAAATATPAPATPAPDADAATAAIPDPAAIQQQFDLDMASLLFADETEHEAILTEALLEPARGDGYSIAEVHEARARFVDELERGVDPQQALEGFLPALLPIARTAITIVGRDRVVGLLARPLAKFIGRYAAPEIAGKLSQAIVDAGLRMVTLEVPSGPDVQRLAPQTIASTVEDTVRRLAELDVPTLEQPALFEAAVTEAFHQAAAENFPPALLLPELHEATAGGTWVAMPLNGTRKYYKKYTRVFDVEITPQIAASLKTFGGVTLTAFLKDRLHLTPPVRARVHLYQAMHGTSPGRIARLERGVPGLGKLGRHVTAQLHPLTMTAAGILLREPRLGRDVRGRYRSRRHRIAHGQRLYYLEIAGARPVPVTGGGRARAAAGRSSEVNVALDFQRDEYRVHTYLSEGDAQDIAAKLRARDTTAVLVGAKRIYEPGVAAVLGGGLEGKVKILAEVLTHEDSMGRALTRLPEPVRTRLVQKVVEWIGRGLAGFIPARSAEFIAAAEDPADGVTLVVTIASPPGATLVRRLLRGEAGAGAGGLDAGLQGDPKVTVKTVAGFRVD